ncbi:hypothetical protein [Streptomyces chryseus]|uniref:Acb2/Tad1 hairpin domain-containing protein n=1 Tax=Streptomyces chryseus TaxID=68186 RepID=A0ABQ3DHP7_9ACTN|nr:hypothetical protein [Streptomyces chryseus]GHA94079.1 hypothetical protein GCM10010346_16000 [Streptomyces chryseus]
MAINENEIRTRFAAPATDEARTAIKTRLAAAAQEFALLVHELVPGSREESEAISSVELALWWAQAGVDRRYVPRRAVRPLTPADAEAACLAAMAEADIASAPGWV